MKIISVPFENFSRCINTTAQHKSRTNLFCTVTPNICSSSVWDFLPANVLVERIFMWSLRSCKIWKYLVYALWNRTKNICCYIHPVVLV